MRFNKSFTRSITALSFSLLFLIAAFARPAFAQSDQDASPGKTKPPVSKLSVSPMALSYSVNLDKAATETKHFTIKNTGTLAAGLAVTVFPPSSSDYVITSGSGSNTVAAKGSLVVDVEFIPHGPATDNGSIAITSNATSGKQDATVTLKGKATQKKPTPTATATATATATSTPTPSPSLLSITESPKGAPILVGATQQFTAMGTYSDGSTRDLTSSVSWGSSDTAVATVDKSGLASAIGVGSSTIDATDGSISGSAAVIVTTTCGTGTGTLTLGEPEDHILDFGQFGTYCTPDGHLTYMRQTDGSIRLWISGGVIPPGGGFAVQGTIGFVTNDFANLTPLTLFDGNAVAGFGPSGPGTENFDADYAGPGSTIRASNGTDLLLFYHAENHLFGGVHNTTTPVYWSIGVARSSDNGVTWTGEGQIIRGIAPKPTSPPYCCHGAQAPSVIVVGGYIYLYYLDTGTGLYSDVIHLARATVASDGAPGSWTKYYNGSFSQPGLGGLSTPVQNQVPPGATTEIAAWPDVSYNTYLQEYLLVFETNDGYYYSTSPDLVTWTVQGKIFSFPGQFDHPNPGDVWYLYQTLVSPEQPDDKTTSCSGYLYYAKNPDYGAPVCHSIFRRPFFFN